MEKLHFNHASPGFKGSKPWASSFASEYRKIKNKDLKLNVLFLT